MCRGFPVPRRAEVRCQEPPGRRKPPKLPEGHAQQGHWKWGQWLRTGHPGSSVQRAQAWPLWPRRGGSSALGWAGPGGLQEELGAGAHLAPRCAFAGKTGVCRQLAGWGRAPRSPCRGRGSLWSGARSQRAESRVQGAHSGPHPGCHRLSLPMKPPHRLCSRGPDASTQLPTGGLSMCPSV